jgi:hypothetical protein
MRNILRLSSISLLGGIFTAWACVISLDQKINVSALFEPVVFPASTLFGVVAGLIMFPFTYFFLNGCRLVYAVPVLWLASASCAIVLNFFNYFSAIVNICLDFIFVIAFLLILHLIFHCKSVQAENKDNR